MCRGPAPGGAANRVPGRSVRPDVGELIGQHGVQAEVADQDVAGDGIGGDHVDVRPGLAVGVHAGALVLDVGELGAETAVGLDRDGGHRAGVVVGHEQHAAVHGQEAGRDAVGGPGVELAESSGGRVAGERGDPAAGLILEGVRLVHRVDVAAVRVEGQVGRVPGPGQHGDVADRAGERVVGRAEDAVRGPGDVRQRLGIGADEEAVPGVAHGPVTYPGRLTDFPAGAGRARDPASGRSRCGRRRAAARRRRWPRARRRRPTGGPGSARTRPGRGRSACP